MYLTPSHYVDKSPCLQYLLIVCCEMLQHPMYTGAAAGPSGYGMAMAAPAMMPNAGMMPTAYGMPAMYNMQPVCTCMYLYREPQIMCHFTFVHIFASYWPIFKILSLAHSADNLRQCDYFISHHTVNAFYTTLWNINISKPNDDNKKLGNWKECFRPTLQ